MPARTNTLNSIRIPQLWPVLGRKQSLTEPLQQLHTPITDAFHEYIHNDIPTRFIDTTKLTFVERDDVFDIFSADIAKITDEDIQNRMLHVKVDTNPEAGIYLNPKRRRKEALREAMRDVVQYAIFSHRWTKSEPTYQDISSGGLSTARLRTTRKDGLAKLYELCETARSLGYRLIWSDTCCIDKTNNVELNEAIHAMFKWYAQAHTCIVHLGASLNLKDFDFEPWFKRGWTLQELLAPRRIKFYGKTWHPFTNLLNDKEDLYLMSAISNVTRIPGDVIVADNSRGIKGHGVWEIMSWASMRKTTRIEDEAYCLCGLFDVNIPIAYGEGDRAFPKLVEAIAARDRAWDVFAWEGQASDWHPALPSAPACYEMWDEAMVSGDVGMTEFTLSPHGLRLVSVPLIPMEYASKEGGRNGTYTVTLRPRSNAAKELGLYSHVSVICGASRLELIRDAKDLHACILNYKPSRWRHHDEGELHHDRGRLQVGRAYVCFLLHVKDGEQEGEGTTWLKVATENILRVVCKGAPKATSPERVEDGMFDLPLRMTYIRVPRARQLRFAAS